MTVSEEFLVVARLCLLALVYLTFLLVAMALRAGLQAEQTAHPAGGATGLRRGGPAGRRRGIRHGARPKAAPVQEAGPAAEAASDGARARSAGQVWTAPAVLLQLSGQEAGRRSGLTPETTIGRDASCGVRLDDPLVSKRHARVFRHGAGWTVEDLGSTNGTLLNGAELSGPAAVSPGDRLQVGDTVLEIVLGTAPEAPLQGAVRGTEDGS